MKNKRILVFILIIAVLLVTSCQESGKIEIFGIDKIPEKYIGFSVYGIYGEEIIVDIYVNSDYKKDISVADLSRDICRELNMPLVFSGVGALAYVQGINSLFEFDHGPESGWLYSVNGEYQGMGCDAYILQDGDYVEWRYTLDFGRDLGAFVLGE